MSSAHLSAAPSDPYQWRESVLSTRSLSYMSTIDALNPRANGVSPSRYASSNHSRANMERSMTEDSEYDSLAPELPESVAESPLFVLPREIRDRIYSFCFTAQNGLPVEWPSSSQKGLALQPQLLPTCKIIYSEAAPLLYTSNTLSFHHPSDANMFVRAISHPHLGRQIAHLNLQIKAQDTRLWMPYLTSKDGKRSLKADFPRLKELGVRFRSNKWQHGLTVEANMRLWAEDSRLDEIIDGLRHVFLPERGTRDEVLAMHNERREAALHTLIFAPVVPAIKVICACRVHAGHFSSLTTTPSLSTSSSSHNDGGGPRSNEQNAILAAEMTAPVIEGEPFRGYTSQDLRNGHTKKVHDPDLGSANVARTPFTDKNGILVALEVHCLDVKRDGA